VKPTGYEDARNAEKAELDRERVRLWYVAATRACEVLILPRFDVVAKGSAWISLLDLALANLPALDLSHLPPEIGSDGVGVQNTQTHVAFAAEAEVIADGRQRIVWLAPSRDENASGPALQTELPDILMTDIDGAPVQEGIAPPIQGGRERGLVLHKLFEEVLTGETVETEIAIVDRARELIRAIGQPLVTDPAQGLAPAELADSVLRALNLPEIVALRPGLTPEFPVYASTLTGKVEEATAGIADAIAFGADGKPHVIIDWKTDVAPVAETLEHYRAQVRAYLDVTQAERGLIVLATSGTIITVERTTATVAAS
jgi:exodeoxyribonuclease-5